MPLHREAVDGFVNVFALVVAAVLNLGEILAYRQKRPLANL
jgi:hypothetical protein